MFGPFPTVSVPMSAKVGGISRNQNVVGGAEGNIPATRWANVDLGRQVGLN